MTSHLLTDGFVSRISFFLPVSPLSPPSRFGSQSKAEMLLYLRRVGFFLCVFYLAGERVSGRGRPLRGGGGGGSGGGGTRVHAAATGERAGSYAAVRGLRQSGRVGQNLRPGGTSAGSCGKKPDERARGREPERRKRDTDRQQGEREQTQCDGGGAGVQWVGAATGVREQREQERAQPPATSRARALTGGHTRGEARAGGSGGGEVEVEEEGAHAIPRYLRAAFTCYRKWHRPVGIHSSDLGQKWHWPRIPWNTY